MMRRNRVEIELRYDEIADREAAKKSAFSTLVCGVNVFATTGLLSLVLAGNVASVKLDAEDRHHNDMFTFFVSADSASFSSVYYPVLGILATIVVALGVAIGSYRREVVERLRDHLQPRQFDLSQASCTKRTFMDGILNRALTSKMRMGCRNGCAVICNKCYGEASRNAGSSKSVLNDVERLLQAGEFIRWLTLLVPAFTYWVSAIHPNEHGDQYQVQLDALALVAGFIFFFFAALFERLTPREDLDFLVGVGQSVMVDKLREKESLTGAGLFCYEQYLRALKASVPAGPKKFWFVPFCLVAILIGSALLATRNMMVLVCIPVFFVSFFGLLSLPLILDWSYASRYSKYVVAELCKNLILYGIVDRRRPWCRRCRDFFHYQVRTERIPAFFVLPVLIVFSLGFSVLAVFGGGVSFSAIKVLVVVAVAAFCWLALCFLVGRVARSRWLAFIEARKVH